MVNLIAISHSKVTSIRWSNEDVTITKRIVLWAFATLSGSPTSKSRRILPKTNKGCTVRPVNASVTAKQVSKMLLLVRSRGLVFTAIITCTLSTTVKGQAMLLMMIPNGTFASSLAVLLIFVTFVKLASKKLAMLIFSCFSRPWSPAWVIDKCFHFTFSHELHLRRKRRRKFEGGIRKWFKCLSNMTLQSLFNPHLRDHN